MLFEIWEPIVGTCGDEDVVVCLDEGVLECLGNYDKDAFDVDFLHAHPLEYYLQE